MLDLPLLAAFGLVKRCNLLQSIVWAPFSERLRSLGWLGEIRGGRDRGHRLENWGAISVSCVVTHAGYSVRTLKPR
jgi:hypothetical protein